VRLGHARWSRSLTGPHAGLARLLGCERWWKKIPKRSKKVATEGLEPAPLGLERGCSATQIQVCLWLEGSHRPFIMYASGPPDGKWCLTEIYYLVFLHHT
jgi:hypothetical protein